MSESYRDLHLHWIKDALKQALPESPRPLGTSVKVLPPFAKLFCTCYTITQAQNQTRQRFWFLFQNVSTALQKMDVKVSYIFVINKYILI